MSDEPQPQQPTPGWAPTEPQADGDPNTPEARPAGKPKRTGWRRIIPTWRMTLGAFIIVTLLLVGGFSLGYSLVKIPPANALATKQANVYLYADGSVIARDGEINRENVSLPQISKDAQHAILAAEDRDFYTESAVDPKAMVRAAWNTALGKGKQSGSTITQQYVKNYYLRQEQTVTRKAKEFFIAIKLDREQSKDHILEGYLNTSYFGRNAYGIQAAAQAYYGMDAKDLDPARGAYLAALVNAPSQYDVVAHPENRKAAESRWNYVLDGMVKKGWLSESKRAGMKFRHAEGVHPLHRHVRAARLHRPDRQGLPHPEQDHRREPARRRRLPHHHDAPEAQAGRLREGRQRQADGQVWTSDNGGRLSVAGGRLQPHHGDQQQAHEEDPGGGGRLPQHDHAEHRRTGRADAHPHAVGGTDGQGPGRMRQQQHAGDDAGTGENAGERARETVGVLHTDGPPDFEQTGDDEQNPGHDGTSGNRADGAVRRLCLHPGTARLVGDPSNVAKQRRRGR
ncbi:Biosynthetic peptidoglycan transglycosylase [Streptomyces violarus]